ncbi:hypothetical protein GCM10009844_41230 [Nocardioides koreensis]|uniref:Uncharacterized protein n=1 Tax=Nocardioides koreensis TaxID=433651 RepID=A0ABN3A684_9ACTN
MYSVETAACHENDASAEETACGPSSARDRPSSGTGTTRADHTVNERPPATPEARETTLPIPHDSAPSRHRTSAAALT